MGEGGNIDDGDEDDDINEPHYILANVMQMALINKMMPKGFKFELYEVVKRQTDLHSKKTTGLVNFM